MLTLLPLLLLAVNTPDDPFADPGTSTVVLLFTRADCPVSNRYAPEVTRLESEYSPRGVRFWLVYPDPSSTAAQREAHRSEYGYRMPAIPDPAHRLVARAAAVVTPEAAVFVRAAKSWKRVYRGRIDDRYVDFGKYRPAPQRHDLAEVLDRILAGQPIRARETKSIGCAIADLRWPRLRFRQVMKLQHGFASIRGLGRPQPAATVTHLRRHLALLRRLLLLSQELLHRHAHPCA